MRAAPPTSHGHSGQRRVEREAVPRREQPFAPARITSITSTRSGRTGQLLVRSSGGAPGTGCDSRRSKSATASRRRRAVLLQRSSVSGASDISTQTLGDLIGLPSPVVEIVDLQRGHALCLRDGAKHRPRSRYRFESDRRGCRSSPAAGGRAGPLRA
jgi:hypothetical protein